MAYFDYFPQVSYDMNKDGRNLVSVTNIIRRFKPIDTVIMNARLYDSHYVQDGERPDTVSNWYYNSPFYDWLVLMFNQILDPYFQWPLTYNQFRLYLEKQYGSYQNSTQLIHHYEWITTPQSQLVDGTNIAERVLWVDQATYLSLPFDETRTVYVYDYETKMNQQNHIIKILDPSYIPQLERERASIFNG